MHNQQSGIKMKENKIEPIFGERPKTKEQIRLDQMGRLLNFKVRQMLLQKDRK